MQAGLSPIAVTIHGGSAVSRDEHGYRVPKRDLVSAVQVLLQNGRLRIAEGLPLANRNLSVLPESCREGIFQHLRHKQHHKDGFFELVVARTLQELGADIECEPENPIDRSRVDYAATFADGTVFAEAVSPVLDKELGAALKRESPLTQLINDNVPTGWAAHVRVLPNVGPDESKRHIKTFLQREMNLPSPTREDDEVEITGPFEQGSLRVILIPQSCHGLSEDTKVAIRNAIAYFPNDHAVLRGAVKRKYRQLSNLDGTSLVALNMFSTTANRDDLDRALFGTSETQMGQFMNEVRRYRKDDGLFAGGIGEPTISGVLAFPEVGFLGCQDPVLWVHPRFEGEFPRALNDLETRYAPYAPDADPEVIVRPANETNLLRNLGFVEKR
jgi:hypothetical protein